MFMRVVTLVTLKIAPAGGENQSRDREGAEVERCSVGASEPFDDQGK